MGVGAPVETEYGAITWSQSAAGLPRAHAAATGLSRDEGVAASKVLLKFGLVDAAVRLQDRPY